MPDLKRLLLATTNPGKVSEYTELLAGLRVVVITLKEAGIRDIVEETGVTIEENAILKARTYSDLSGLLTIADDSGLEVDALGGEPGVRSARYAGASTAEARNQILLDKLNGIPPAQRTARFRCVIAVTGPGLAVETSEATCEGSIAKSPLGTNGFGYDPIFHIPKTGLRMAQLSSHEKNLISHRGKAMAGARPLVEALL